MIHKRGLLLLTYYYYCCLYLCAGHSCLAGGDSWKRWEYGVLPGDWTLRVGGLYCMMDVKTGVQATEICNLDRRWR